MDPKYAKYLLQKTKNDYNLAAKDFSKRRQTIWLEMRFLFDDYLVPGDRVLDLGCGNGRFFEVMEDKDVNYIGVDISEKLIEIAKKRYLRPPSPAHKLCAGFRRARAKFQVADGLNLPFPNNYFDKVYCIAALHHIPSKPLRCQFLQEAKRVLKENGILIVTSWNLWSSWKKIKQIIKFALLKILGRSRLDFKDVLLPFAGMEKCYFHCFTLGELKKLTTQAGLSLKESGEIITAQEKRPNSNFYIIAEKQTF